MVVTWKDYHTFFEDWPICDCLIAFHSSGFPLEKSINYAKLRTPFIINNLVSQFDIQVKRKQAHSRYKEAGQKRKLCTYIEYVLVLLSLPGFGKIWFAR